MTWRSILCGWAGCAGLLAAPAEIGFAEVHFDRALFEVKQLGIEGDEAARMAGELVKVAYFLSDRPQEGAKSLAVAHSLVPRHSGAMVASFRLRSGKAPEEVPMVDPDEAADLLADNAARLLERHPSGGANQAVACLVEIALALPLRDPGLRERLVQLDDAVAAADWSAAFPAPPAKKAP